MSGNYDHLGGVGGGVWCLMEKNIINFHFDYLSKTKQLPKQKLGSNGWQKHTLPLKSYSPMESRMKEMSASPSP